MHVELQGFDAFGRRLDALPARTAQEARTAMQAGLLLLEADQRRHVPQDTRRLMGSITSSIEGTGLTLTGQVGPTTRYAWYVEHGRRPGRYPPIDAIAGWARRHGIPPFLVARAIARRGTRAQPFVGPSLERNRAAIDRLFQRVGLRVTQFLAGRG